jgi:hypothetical protein
MLLLNLRLRWFLVATLRPCCAGVLGGLAYFAPSSAVAGTTCSMRIVADGVDAAWATAARDLARHLRSDREGNACGSIHLRVAGDSVDLVLVTQDGRRAVRELAEPTELAPTVEAMLINLDSDSAETRHELVSSDRAVVEPGPPDQRPAPQLETPAKQATSVVIGGSLGVRVGGNLATPVVGAFGSLVSDPWEIGVAGQWEAAYQSLGADSPRPWSAAAIAAGVALGRRQHLSSALDLRAGVTLAGALLHQETHHQKPEQWLTRADARLGGYAGLLWPRRGVIRFRTELAFDVIPPTGQSQSAAPDVAALPTWAASLTIGAETNGP